MSSTTAVAVHGDRNAASEGGPASAAEQAGTSDPASRVVPGRVRIDRYGLDLGPWLHLADERTRLSRPSFAHISVTPQGATLGAEVGGVDLGSDLSDEVIAEIRQALLDYKVLIFRDQPITPSQHVAFARRFGELEIHPFITGNHQHPELVRFEKGVDTGGFENGWHHDVTWREVPSMGAILHAIQVPATGGDTLFCDMAAAYDGLDDATRERIDGLFAVHDFMLAFKHQVPEGKHDEFRARYPLARHPVVCTHPETGRKLIFVNCYFTSHIDGMGHRGGHRVGQAPRRPGPRGRVPVQGPLATRHRRLLGQPLRAALRGQRLLPRRPDHGAGQHRGHPPDLRGVRPRVRPPSRST